MGILADKLREKSKHDAVIIAGSEIREALCELETELEMTQNNFEAFEKDNKILREHIDLIERDLDLLLREALEDGE